MKITAKDVTAILKRPRYYREPGYDHRALERYETDRSGWHDMGYGRKVTPAIVTQTLNDFLTLSKKSKITITETHIKLEWENGYGYYPIDEMTKELILPNL